jgi:hypothetical protein
VTITVIKKLGSPMTTANVKQPSNFTPEKPPEGEKQNPTREDGILMDFRLTSIHLVHPWKNMK